MISSPETHCEQTTAMKTLFFSCLFGLVALGNTAEAAKNVDCSVARDPRRCEARQMAQEACNGLQGQARSACVSAAMPPPDCSYAPDTTQCQAKQTEKKQTRGKARKNKPKVQS
jgi:hypothetical protein